MNFIDRALRLPADRDCVFNKMLDINLVPGIIYL